MRGVSVFVKQEVLFLTENMLRKSQNLKYMLSLVPGKKRFGVYRFLPVFFCIGGVMEWIMINVRIGRETFYDVYRRKQSERAYQQKTEEGLIMLTDSQAKWQHHNISMKRLKPVHWTLEYVGHQLEGSCDMDCRQEHRWGAKDCHSVFLRMVGICVLSTWEICL